MKKLLILFWCCFSVTSLAQMIDTPYDFPVKPGSHQWAKLSSSKEMDEVSTVPDGILSSLTTRALLITCLNYPRIIDFFLAEDMQAGFVFYSIHFNGLAELLMRPDLNQVLLKSYIGLELPSSKMSEYDVKLTFMQIAFWELLLSQETIINKYDENEIKLLHSEAIKKLEQRQKGGESLYRQRTSALIISRILFSENKNISEYDKYGTEIFSLFNSHIIVADTTIIQKLLDAGKKITFD